MRTDRNNIIKGFAKALIIFIGKSCNKVKMYVHIICIFKLCEFRCLIVEILLFELSVVEFFFKVSDFIFGFLNIF